MYTSQVDKKLNVILKETRENKNITLEEASASTKIRKSILIEIEKGNYQSITSEIHLKNFIINYGKFLGISEEKILALYRRDLSTKNKKNQTQKITNLIQKDKISYFIKKIYQNILSTKTIVIFFTLLIILIISYFFYRTWLISNTPPTLTIITPQNNEVIRQKNFVIEGISNGPDVKIYVDGIEATYLDSKGWFKVEAKFNNPGLKRFNIIAINSLQRKSEYNLDLIYQPDNTINNLNQAKTVKLMNKSNNIQKLIIDYDSKTKEEVFIKPNDIYEIKINNIKEIKINNPNKNKFIVYIPLYEEEKNEIIDHNIKEFDNTNIFIKIIQDNIFLISTND